MRRRDLIGIFRSAMAWPLAARAQQPAMPMIGYLDTRSPDAVAERLRAFRQGLKETGYVERENVGIEYRWAEGQYDRLPELAAELVRRPVTAIVAAYSRPAGTHDRFGGDVSARAWPVLDDELLTETLR
jgi:putative ABC transport system substrate-binding protein